MNRRLPGAMAVLLSLFVLAGCWDGVELTDRAIWLATGWDAGKDGKIRLTGQMIIPAKIASSNVGGASGGGGAGGGGGGGGTIHRGYFAITKEGIGVGDALQAMQSELSRELFTGHRRAILIGEELARQGVKDVFEANIRSARVSIRTDMFVVRGAEAEEALGGHSIFEPIPASAIIKNHRQIGGRGDRAFLDFLIAAKSDGMRPALPVLEFYEPPYDRGHKKLRMAGLAVFDAKLKLAGFLNLEENRDFLWIRGDLTKRTLSLVRDNGAVSMNLLHMSSKIVPKIGDGGKVHIHVILRANGSLFENNSDFTNQRSEIKLLEREFERQTERQVLRTIRKVQRKFGADIFGFGEALRRRKPRRWQSLRSDWDRHFSEAEISVSVDLTIQQEGLSEFPAFHKGSGRDK